MITIKKLKQELERFKDNDECFAYEGEICGLVIERKDENGKLIGEQGWIICSCYTDIEDDETKTIEE